MTDDMHIARANETPRASSASPTELLDDYLANKGVIRCAACGGWGGIHYMRRTAYVDGFGPARRCPNASSHESGDPQ